MRDDDLVIGPFAEKAVGRGDMVHAVADIVRRSAPIDAADPLGI